MQQVVESLANVIEEYKDTQNLEIEIRIGYLTPDGFDTNIGKDFFSKIGDQLADADCWNDVKFEKSTDYFLNNRRLTVNDEVKTTTCIKKIKLKTIDYRFEGTGFDIRVSLSSEIPSPKFSPTLAQMQRYKERTSYVRKHLRYDLTKVTTSENALKKVSYEVEVESMRVPPSTEMSRQYFVHDMLLKIGDIVSMCEPVETLHFVQKTSDNKSKKKHL